LASTAFFLEQQPKIVVIDGGEEEEGTAGNDEIGTPAAAAAAAEGIRRKAQQQQLASKNSFPFKMVQRQRFTGNSGENQASRGVMGRMDGRNAKIRTFGIESANS
jgi:hypothetical protein